MSETSGAAFLEEIKVIAPKLTPVVFSAYEDADQLFKSAPGGASGYLFRRTAPNCILEPVIKGLGQMIPGRESTATSIRNYFAESISSLPVGGAVHQLANLTPREHEILALLSKGHPDKEIADLLRISTWTVHGHLKKIFEKLGAHNRTDAVVKYLHK
jgi:DNA-binding NarL/FixJ family response regulator